MRLAEDRSRRDAPGEPDGGGRGLRRFGHAPRHGDFEQLQQRHAGAGGAAAAAGPNAGARRSMRAHPPRNYAEDFAYGSAEDGEPAVPAPARLSGRRHVHSGVGRAASPGWAHHQQGDTTQPGGGLQEAYTSSGRAIRRPASYAEAGSPRVAPERQHAQQQQPRSGAQRSTRHAASIDGAGAASQDAGVAVSRSGRPVKRHNYAEEDAWDEQAEAAAVQQPPRVPRRRGHAAGGGGGAAFPAAPAASPRVSPRHATRGVHYAVAGDADSSEPEDAGSDGFQLPAWGAGRRSDRSARQPASSRPQPGPNAWPSDEHQSGSDVGAGPSEAAGGRRSRLRIKLHRR